MSNDDYRDSPLVFRMAVFIRLGERDCDVTIEQLADEAGLSAMTVFHAHAHTPATMARLCEVLGWPPDRFEHLVPRGRGRQRM